MRDPPPASAEAVSQPAFDVQVVECCEVRRVCGHEGQPVDSSDGRDLAVDKRRRRAHSSQSYALPSVPVSRPAVVIHHFEAFQHDFFDIALDHLASARLGKSTAPKAQFVPDQRRNCDLAVMLTETPQHPLRQAVAATVPTRYSCPRGISSPTAARRGRAPCPAGVRKARRGRVPSRQARRCRRTPDTHRRNFDGWWRAVRTPGS